MGDEADAGESRRRRPRLRTKLPVVAVNSREDMAVMLALHGGLMRSYARHYLGDVPDEVVEEAVTLTVTRLLAIEQPSFPHGLWYAVLVLGKESRGVKRRFEQQGVPVDRRLGELTGPKLRALEQLGPRAQALIRWSADGKTSTEMARLLHTTPQAVRIRLHRARTRMKELMGEAGAGLSGVLLAAPRRSRLSATRHLHAWAGTATSQPLAATAFVPLMACSLLWAGVPARPPVAVQMVAVAPTHSPQPAVRGGAAAPPYPISGVSVERPVHEVAVAAGSKSVPASIRNASQETPEDVTLTALATPADGRPVIVAIGKGHGCNCTEKMRSLDGGATWTATDGPPSGADQVVVPPDYPHDPRIFAGSEPMFGQVPYAAGTFGQPFQPLKTLPAGHLAVSSHFDDGDPRVFSAATTAVWSIRIDAAPPAAPVDEIDYPAAAATTGTVAALATPSPSQDGPALLVWSPSPATFRGSPASPALTSSVAQCPVASSCVPSGTLPVPPWRLEASASTVIAYTRAVAYISHDGGSSFTPLSLPQDVAAVGSLALPGTAPTPWVSFARINREAGVALMPGAGAPWVDAIGDADALRSHFGVLVAVGSDRIIEAFPDFGYRCRMVAGGPWMPRCAST